MYGSKTPFPVYVSSASLVAFPRFLKALGGERPHQPVGGIVPRSHGSGTPVSSCVTFPRRTQLRVCLYCSRLHVYEGLSRFAERSMHDRRFTFRANVPTIAVAAAE